MNKKEVAKGKNLFDEEKIIDTGIKEPLFIRIPFDEYKKYRKLQEENEKLKDRIEYLGNEKYALYQDNISLLKEKYGAESLNYKYIETPPVEVEGYISEDKIRTKIKELEAEYKKCEKEGLLKFADKLDIGTRIDVLRELLN